MALGDPIFSLCVDNCKSFGITDKLGLFNAGQNPGGWDQPTLGPFAAAVTSDTLDVKFPDGHIITTSLLDGTIPFPAANFPEKDVPNTALGMLSTDKFPNGIYTMTRKIDLLNVSNDPEHYEAKLDFWVDCQAWCCVAKLYAKIPKNAAPCDGNGPQCLADKAKAKLVDAKYAFECGDYDGAILLMSQVESLCLENNCGC